MPDGFWPPLPAGRRKRGPSMALLVNNPVNETEAPSSSRPRSLLAVAGSPQLLCAMPASSSDLQFGGPHAIDRIPTPCMLISLSALEHNESCMRRMLRGSGVALRPHVKAHKSSQLAAWQIRQSQGELAGFCAKNVTEAEALVRAGAADILITNTLPPRAAASLAALAAAHPSVTFGTLVDCTAHIAALEAAASAAGTSLRVLVEIECGMDRCGVAANSDAPVALARAIIAASPSLQWGGLHVYAGNLGQVRSASARRAAVEAGPATAAGIAVARLSAAGIRVPVVTGGGTGTAAMDVERGTHSEVQPGAYLLMDAKYAHNEDTAFHQALYVHATCISADEA